MSTSLPHLHITGPIFRRKSRREDWWKTEIQQSAALRKYFSNINVERALQDVLDTTTKSPSGLGKSVRIPVSLAGKEGRALVKLVCDYLGVECMEEEEPCWSSESEISDDDNDFSDPKNDEENKHVDQRETPLVITPTVVKAGNSNVLSY